MKIISRRVPAQGRHKEPETLASGNLTYAQLLKAVTALQKNKEDKK